MRLLECSSDLQFDRSILTGESKSITATVNDTCDNFMEARNIALQGCANFLTFSLLHAT